MKKSNKKRIAGICGGITALFIAPLIVFAAIYYSSERKNSFAPGSVDIEVNEGNDSSDEGEELEKDDYIWVKSGEIYTADKDVKIKDTRKNPGEVLRVCFIPMWYDKDDNGEPDNVCDVFNFGSQPTQNDNAFTYTDGDKTITLKMASEMASAREQSGWSYSDPAADPPGDGCFYYNGPLESGNLTAQLLDSVELNEKAYELTENYVFRLDVLADAIQSSGDAYATREWNPPREWNTP